MKSGARLHFSALELSGAFLLDLEPRSDERGYFARVFCEDELAQHGLQAQFVQVNTAFNPHVGTLRGMHYQESPHAEVKIIRCVRGKAFDVAVDLRPASPTFKRWVGAELDPQSGRMLYIPEGCAHGYVTLTDDTEIMYFASHRYAPSAARGIRHDDASIGINWPVPILIVSKADRDWPAVGTDFSARTE